MAARTDQDRSGIRTRVLLLLRHDFGPGRISHVDAGTFCRCISFPDNAVTQTVGVRTAATAKSACGREIRLSDFRQFCFLN
ncbi:MAG: hypothetical protein IJS01_00605 [Lentisphaeria bacterium]|nr:hypothetical protein [Lentisphaeria bacterium]